jgi:hypothetical protein
MTETTTKVCTGPDSCGRELPLDTDHFHRNASHSAGFKVRCKDCENAIQNKRREERAAGANVSKRAKAHVSRLGADLAAELAAKRAAGAAELSDALAALAELTAGAGLVSVSTPDGRREFIGRRIAANPDAPAAQSGARARRALADFEAELRRPPFVTAELFLLMADNAFDGDAESVGLGAFGRHLAAIGWAPESVG